MKTGRRFKRPNMQEVPFRLSEGHRAFVTPPKGARLSEVDRMFLNKHFIVVSVK